MSDDNAPQPSIQERGANIIGGVLNIQERFVEANKIGNAPKAEWTAIFITLRNDSTMNDAYRKVLNRMLEAVNDIEGFRGLDVAYLGMKDITVTYWDSLEAIGRWKRHLEHLSAQKKGKEMWFDGYRVVIARVEKEYGFILPDIMQKGAKVPVNSEEAPGPET